MIVTLLQFVDVTTGTGTNDIPMPIGKVSLGELDEAHTALGTRPFFCHGYSQGTRMNNLGRNVGFLDGSTTFLVQRIQHRSHQWEVLRRSSCCEVEEEGAALRHHFQVVPTASPLISILEEESQSVLREVRLPELLTR